MFEHFIAELECELYGHIDSRGGELDPVVVRYCYGDGTEEKVADNICSHCGHFITNGITRIREQKHVPDYLKESPPDAVARRLEIWRKYSVRTKKFKIDKIWQGNRYSGGNLPDVIAGIDIKEKTYASKSHSNIVGAIDELKKLVQVDYPSAEWLLYDDVEYFKIPVKELK